tara:strand:- start:71 stop:898 length:828 start_codon:yes stop_codon:yes gene_type:complete
MSNQTTLNEYNGLEIIHPKDKQATPLIIHIPHSSTFIPDTELTTFSLSSNGLESELLKMTDRYTDDLFSRARELGGTMFVNRISRLVCDPERFPDDESEPMSKKGMGAVYTKTAGGDPLKKNSFNSDDKKRVMEQYFHPYSKALEGEVAKMLENFGKCFIVDGHSFPTIPLPYEDPNSNRPDICLGYDSFHAPSESISALENICRSKNYTFNHNEPFSGSYVPLKYFQKEPKIKSLMIEIRRGTYMNESSGYKSKQYDQTKKLIFNLLEQVVSAR